MSYYSVRHKKAYKGRTRPPNPWKVRGKTFSGPEDFSGRLYRVLSEMEQRRGGILAPISSSIKLDVSVQLPPLQFSSLAARIRFVGRVRPVSGGARSRDPRQCRPPRITQPNLTLHNGPLRPIWRSTALIKRQPGKRSDKSQVLLSCWQGADRWRSIGPASSVVSREVSSRMLNRG
jgi:hypothetical protein